MKAVRLHGVRDLRVEEVELPRVARDAVLVRVEACGVCPTDLRKYTGRVNVDLPFTLGHEIAGIVEQVGADVTQVEPGARVAVAPVVYCGRCRPCRRGMENLCHHKTGIGGSIPGPAVPGGFAEFVAVPESSVYPLPENVPFSDAVFADPLACCINAVDKCRLQTGDKVLVVGAGPNGLLFVQLLRHRGARVMVSEPDESRLEWARRLGAEATVNPAEEDLLEAVRGWTDGEGADACIVAVGNPAAQQDALGVVGVGGVVNLFAGTYPPDDLRADPNCIHYGERILTGTFAFTADHFRRALAALARGHVNVDVLITERLPLDQLAEAFEKALKREGLKKVIQPWP